MAKLTQASLRGRYTTVLVLVTVTGWGLGSTDVLTIRMMRIFLSLPCVSRKTRETSVLSVRRRRGTGGYCAAKRRRLYTGRRSAKLSRSSSTLRDNGSFVLAGRCSSLPSPSGWSCSTTTMCGNLFRVRFQKNLRRLNCVECLNYASRRSMASPRFGIMTTIGGSNESSSV